MEYFLIAGACFVAAYGFGYFLMRRVQAHLIEYFFTLVASTIPMGIILSVVRHQMTRHFHDITACVILGLLPVCLIIGGSVWGISAANRLGILNARQRLGLMALGWGFVVSVCGVAPLLLAALHGFPFCIFGLPIVVTMVVAARELEKRAAVSFYRAPNSDQVVPIPRPCPFPWTTRPRRSI